MVTDAPALASPSAIARPMPPVDPLTTALRPVRSMIIRVGEQRIEPGHPIDAVLGRQHFPMLMEIIDHGVDQPALRAKPACDQAAAIAAAFADGLKRGRTHTPFRGHGDCGLDQAAPGILATLRLGSAGTRGFLLDRLRHQPSVT
jgi:hypothetical protein